MVFYDTSNTHDSLVHYVNFLLGHKESDTTQFSLAAMARSTNSAKYELALMFWQHASGWDWDDEGQTDLPIAVANLVADRRDYTLPTDAIEIERIDIKDSSGNYYRIKSVNKKDIATALTDYGEDSGTPYRYWIDGRSIFLDPAPATGSVTLTNGIRLYLNREIKEFTAATTTSNVGMGEPADRWIAYRVAHEFALIHKPNKAQALQGKMQDLEMRILGKHAQKLRDIEQRIMPEIQTYE